MRDSCPVPRARDWEELGTENGIHGNEPEGLRERYIKIHRTPFATCWGPSPPRSRTWLLVT